MNTYLVGAYILGSAGERVAVSKMIKAAGKDEAQAIFKKLLEDNGWTWGGIDYVDWAD